MHLQHLAVRAQKRIARNPQKREKKPDPDLIITTKKNAETTPTPHPQHHRPARTHQPAPPTKQQPTPFLHQKTRNKPKSNPKTKNNPEQAAPQNHPAFSTKNSNILNTHIPHKRQNPEPAEKRRETKTTQLPPQEKDIALLMQLGLTASEARAYLAFIRTGASQIGSLAKTTGIRREHLYQIVHSLENKGLIQKELGPTSKYKAVSLDETLPMLVKRKQTQIAELQTEAQTLIEQFKKRNQPTTNATKELQEETSQFVIIPGTETVIHRLKEALQKTQTSLDVVTSQERFSPAILEFAPAYKKALERGVKIRIATEKHAAEKAAIETVHNLMKNPAFKVKYLPPRFEVKYFLSPPEAVVSIFDRKQAFVTVSATAHLTGTESLWSNNTSFIALAQAYFESKWNNSIEEYGTPLKTGLPTKPKSSPPPLLQNS